jgi:NADH dehydrogenase FAD-containing subunit
MCALRLARRTRGQVAITLVSAKSKFVERIRLHQRAAGQQPVSRELATMVAGTGITLKISTVTSIDPHGALRVDGERLPFDQLVVALGSQVDVNSVPGIREHAFTLDPTSAVELAERLPAIAARGGSLLVIGGGLTGIEGASELAEAHPGLKVTLLCAGDPGSGFSEEGRLHLHSALARLGVSIEKGQVRRLQAGAAELDGRTLPFDACLWAGGFVAPKVLRESGLPVNARGQVRVDAYLRVPGHEHIHVIGDAAAPIDPPCPLPMACRTAMPMGTHVAESLARLAQGQPEQPFDYLDTGWCISLGRREGLIQPLRRDGTPTRWVLTGRLGAWLKESVCRLVLTTLAAERAGLCLYRWRGTGRKLSSAAMEQEKLAA